MLVSGDTGLKRLFPFLRGAAGGVGEADTVTHRHATVRYTTDRDLDQLLNRYRYSIYMYGPHTDVSSTINYFLRGCLVKRKKKNPSFGIRVLGTALHMSSLDWPQLRREGQADLLI